MGFKFLLFYRAVFMYLVVWGQMTPGEYIVWSYLICGQLMILYTVVLFDLWTTNDFIYYGLIWSVDH